MNFETRNGQIVEYKQGRNCVIDVVRGIAILAIIAGHFGVYAVTRIVFTFHVPIFLIITGYFFRLAPFHSICKKKFKALVLPYFITCIIILVLAALKAAAMGDDTINTIRTWTLASLYGAGSAYHLPHGISPIGAIWFLWATLWATLFLMVCFKWKEIFRLLWVLFLFLVGYYTAHYRIWLPLSIQAGCCGTLYVYLGANLKQHEKDFARVPKIVEAAVGVAAFIIWFVFIYKFKSFSLVRCDFGRGLTDIVGSLCACYCIYLIANGLTVCIGTLKRISLPVTEVLAFFGRNSLIMLCVHVTEMNLIDWWQVVRHLQKFRLPYTICCGVAVGIKLTVIIGATCLIVMIKTHRKNGD